MSLPEIASVAIATGSSGALAAVVGVPATRALSRLILGVADIGLARLERPARLIRAATESLVEDRKAEATKAASAGLVDRASTRIEYQEERRQANREAVAQEAYRLLETDPPETQETVSEEFMSSFERIAEDATSDDLQRLFARILANECRRPGSYSRATVQFMNMMDTSLAREIESWAGLISGVPTALSIPEAPPFAKGRRLLSMKRLASLGLLVMGNYIKYGEELNWFYIDLSVRASAPEKKSLTVAFLTPMGEEVFSLVRRPPSSTDLEDLKAMLEGKGYGNVVTQATVTRDGSLYYDGPTTHL